MRNSLLSSVIFFIFNNNNKSLCSCSRIFFFDNVSRNKKISKKYLSLYIFLFNNLPLFFFREWWAVSRSLSQGFLLQPE